MPTPNFPFESSYEPTEQDLKDWKDISTCTIYNNKEYAKDLAERRGMNTFGLSHKEIIDLIEEQEEADGY